MKKPNVWREQFEFIEAPNLHIIKILQKLLINHIAMHPW